jgi:hypothetical protein
MTTASANLDDTLKRHLELAVRLRQQGEAILAGEVVLGMLQHEPPSLDSEPSRFLVQMAVQMAQSPRTPAAEEWWEHFQSQPDLGQILASHLRRLLRQQWTSVTGDFSHSDEASELTRILQRLESGCLCPGRSYAGRRLPPGCARGVVVYPQGQAYMTRVFVRFNARNPAQEEWVVGQVLPGVARAITAAQQYLAAAGCRPIDHLQAEVLFAGLFRPVQGESLALPVFMAAVSARIGMSLPPDWVFTGALGSATAGEERTPVMPVNEIAAKLSVSARMGCTRLMIPAGLVGQMPTQLPSTCAIVKVESAVQAVELALPSHRLEENPRAISGWRLLYAFGQSMHPLHGQLRTLPQAEDHRLFRLGVPLFFAGMLTERWLFADYLVPEYYPGAARPALGLAFGLGSLGAAILGLFLYGGLTLSDRLLARGERADWWRLAVVLLVGHILAWMAVQPLLRNPLATPPAGLFLEHRTFQWWKDTMVLYFYAVIFFVSPYTRIRLAEAAAAAGRSRWAREIIEGRRWAGSMFPVGSLPMLVVVAAIAIMGLGHLEWQGLTDPLRAGAASTNGPWRILHIVGRAQLYFISCAVALWWMHRSASRLSTLSN